MIQTLFKKSLVRIILCCVAASALPSCVKLPRRAAADHSPQTQTQPAAQDAPLVFINEASPGELEKLPGIGPALAARIVEHRERFGRFRRAEHLLLVRGISERRFQQLRPYVAVEPQTP
jgi:competence protein ComEA